MATVGRGAEQYTVRFPDGLRDRIKIAADRNNRSMNAEIVACLEDRYPPPSPRDRGLVEFLVAYVEKGEDTAEMKRRAKAVNSILKSFDDTEHLAVRALDELGTSVVGKKVTLTTGDFGKV